MKNHVVFILAITTVILMSCDKEIINNPELYNEIPVVITDSSTNVTAYSAIVHGTINTYRISCSYYFEYGTTSSYGSQSVQRNLDTGLAIINVRDTILQLQPVTSYHYSIVSSNKNGFSRGNDQTFTTTSDYYFPHNTGCQWIYSFFDAKNIRFDTVEVNITSPGNWQYTVYSGETGYPEYTEQVLVSPNMVQMNSNVSESRIYMIPFVTGNKWNGPPPQYTFVNYSVSKLDSIITPAGKFYGAFLIHMSAFNGGNTTYIDDRVFVPNIGFVKRNESLTGVVIGTVSSYSWNLISFKIIP